MAEATAQSQPPFFIVDGHLDIAWNALEFGRDPRMSAHQTRRVEENTRIPSYVGQCTTGFPDWVAGGFGLLFATTFVMPSEQAYPGSRFVYHNPEEAALLGQQVLDYYHTLVQGDPALKLIQTQQDLADLMAERSSGRNTLGLLLLMEGAEPLRDPAELPEWYAAGLRILGPAWHATRYAGGTGSPGPLTELGFRLLDEMAALNMVLDLSHIAEEAFYQAIDTYPGPIIASHSNPRAFLPTDRGLSDDMIRQIIHRDGVIGVSLYNGHLQPGWRPGDPRPSLSVVAEVIDHIVQLSGSTRHVALGSDMDGGFGLESIPAELDTCADVGDLRSNLEGRGYTPLDMRAILMENWLRVLRTSLPA
jgi:membrane dipeptidase